MGKKAIFDIQMQKATGWAIKGVIGGLWFILELFILTLNINPLVMGAIMTIIGIITLYVEFVIIKLFKVDNFELPKKKEEVTA